MASRSRVVLMLRLKPDEFAYLSTLVSADLEAGGCPPALLATAEATREKLRRLVPGADEVTP